MCRWLLPFGALLLLSFAAEARIFNYKEANLGAYVRGTGGLSALNQDSFGNSSGAGTTVNGSTAYNYGAEVGVMFGVSEKLHIRLAAEILQENPVNGAGSDSGGNSLFTLNSSVFVFNPNVTFEYVYSMHGNVRFFAEGGVGFANVSVTNKYAMTSAGTTAFAGVTDYTESLQANALSATGGMGLEVLFTDNVTFLADVGYRYLPVHQLKYSSADQSIVAPSGVAKGDVVHNADGSDRHLNLSGVYAGIGFRFYLNFL